MRWSKYYVKYSGFTSLNSIKKFENDFKNQLKRQRFSFLIYFLFFCLIFFIIFLIQKKNVPAGIIGGFIGYLILSLIIGFFFTKVLVWSIFLMVFLSIALVQGILLPCILNEEHSPYFVFYSGILLFCVYHCFALKFVHCFGKALLLIYFFIISGIVQIGFYYKSVQEKIVTGDIANLTQELVMMIGGIIGTLYYIYETCDQEIMKKRLYESKNKNSRVLKKISMKKLPISMLVMSQDREQNGIKFYNNNMLMESNCSNISQLQHFLERLQIFDNSCKEGINHSTDSFKCDDEVIMINFFDFCKKLFIKKNPNVTSIAKLENTKIKNKISYYAVKTSLILSENNSYLGVTFLNLTDIIKVFTNQNSLKNQELQLANISHDLRAPIMGIINNLKLIELETQLNENQLSHVNFCYSYSNIALNYVSDILDSTRISNGNKLLLQITKFPVKSVFEEVANMLKNQYETKKLKLIINYGRHENAVLKNDCTRLRQILVNLVSNAIKHTKIGQIALKCKEELLNNIKTYKFSVKDTGSGMTEEIQERIFHKFASFGSGYGLGLCICQKLAGIIGPNEKIYFKSVVDKGSKFWFFAYAYMGEIQDDESFCSIKIENYKKQSTLVTSKKNPEDFSSYELNEKVNGENSSVGLVSNFEPYTKRYAFRKKSDESPVLQHPKLILIVDDDHMNIVILKKFISKISNFRFSEAKDGEEAIAKFNEEKPDIIFMDWYMPKMNGHDCSIVLKELNCNSPIICTSADEKTLESIKPMNDILKKPLSINEIQKILKKWTDSRQLKKL